MSDVKQFTTAAKKAAERTGETKFKIDERELTVYDPDPSQFALMIASIGRGSSELEQMAGIINFFVKIMDEDSASYIEARLLDSSDPFSIEDVEDIVGWLVEKWSGNPTQSSSGSTSSQENTGEPSQPLTPVST